MKITAMVLALVGSFSLGAAQAAFLQPGSSGTITVTSGCHAFGESCTVNGIGSDDFTDNDSMASTNGIGSAVAGDGRIGWMDFTVGAEGNTIHLTSFHMDTYKYTAMGDFNTRMVDTTNAVGVIDNSGNMTLNLEGRTGIGQFTAYSLGEQAWNLDSHGAWATYCPGTGAYTPFTTGNSTAAYCFDGSPSVNVTGSALSAAGAGAWTGRIVSAGNMGSNWGGFDGAAYSEIFNITVTGVEATTVPVPAAAWLFASGLLGLISLGRKQVV
ncbi:hypothetical protein SCD_n01311 [Sulfuricella denitrificans skB26]|uniref:Uncharacterized protein n=2 Tax=Sulfuricella denitrificans TaxID=649841 RepID=S6ABZ5_SULDS|nr:hypothetical protein SCD_n01311 [Sulfuricella denitrificans skB26]